jgi:hypothetical protein
MVARIGMQFGGQFAMGAAQGAFELATGKSIPTAWTGRPTAGGTAGWALVKLFSVLFDDNSGGSQSPAATSQAPAGGDGDSGSWSWMDIGKGLLVAAVIVGVTYKTITYLTKSQDVATKDSAGLVAKKAHELQNNPAAFANARARFADYAKKTGMDTRELAQSLEAEVSAITRQAGLTDSIPPKVAWGKD